MTRYQLDTHAFLWHALDDPRLPRDVREAVDDPDNDVAVSIASLWEIGSKWSIGKLSRPTNVLGLQRVAEGQCIDVVPISVEAIHHATGLDWFNRDPFDRLIAATAITSGVTLVTIEASFERWGVTRFWSG